MSTQTALGQSFPTPCKRCGGALYRQVDHCPYCGAVHPLDAAPHSRTAMSGGRADATNQTARRLDADPPLSAKNGSTVLAGHPARARRGEVALRTSLVSTTPVPELDEPPYGTGGSRVTIRRVLLAILAIVVIGLAYGAYALFTDNSEPEDSSGEQIESAVNQDARTTTGTIAPLATEQAAHPPDTLKPATPDKSTLAVVAPAKTAPALPAAPIAVLAPTKPVTLQFRDASQALQAAHAAFTANDLSRAQAALASAQALQPGNADAQTMASELRPLSARRDTALQAAQTCVSQQSWSCARQHANEALTIDTGNDTAKAILQLAIRETGWAPLKADASNGGALQGKPPGQTVALSQARQAQAQTPLSKGTQSDGDPGAAPLHANNAGATATTGAGADPGSVEARERSIVDSGWSHAPANGAKTTTAASAAQ